MLWWEYAAYILSLFICMRAVLPEISFSVSILNKNIPPDLVPKGIKISGGIFFKLRFALSFTRYFKGISG